MPPYLPPSPFPRASLSSAEGPFHEGEKAIQARTGKREQWEKAGRRMVQSFMPEPHRELFEKLPTLLVGSLDGERRPWASLLTGRPGFLRSPDERTLRIGALPGQGDPLRSNLTLLTPVGLLGLEPQTRRRNRMNGTVVEIGEQGFTVEVDQSFGNCPQYIHPREPRWADETSSPALPTCHREGSLLTGPARRLIEKVDTFFIASASPEARARGGAHGVDVSHRGVDPGSMPITEENGAHVLTVPDFRGNFIFNTLGNLLLHPRAGLLFVDPDLGDVLQITCTVEIVWEGPEVLAFPSAQRLLRFRIEEGVWTPAASPLRWSSG